jgi:hypothetical protein
LDAWPAKLSGRETLKIRLVYIAPRGLLPKHFGPRPTGIGGVFARTGKPPASVTIFWSVFPPPRRALMTTLLAEARQDGFGMIVLADGPHVPSGEVLASKWREGIFISQTCHGRANKIFSAVDLSPSTHVLLRFLAHAFLGRPGCRFRFVHVLDGSAQAARKRWEKMLPLSGWDADTPLELMPPGPEGVAGTLRREAAGLGCGRRGPPGHVAHQIAAAGQRVTTDSAGSFGCHCGDCVLIVHFLSRERKQPKESARVTIFRRRIGYGRAGTRLERGSDRPRLSSGTLRDKGK